MIVKLKQLYKNKITLILVMTKYFIGYRFTFEVKRSKNKGNFLTNDIFMDWHILMYQIYRIAKPKLDVMIISYVIATIKWYINSENWNNIFFHFFNMNLITYYVDTLVLFMWKMK